MTRRSITGEREGTYSILNLVENVIGLSGNVETRVRKIQEILLLRSDVRRVFDALNDADPATMKAIADHLATLLAQYRRADVDLTMNDFPSLPGILGNYRLLINNQFDSIQLKFGPNYEDLSTRITNLEITGGHRAPTQFFLENNHVWAPNVTKAIRQLRTYQPTSLETHHHWNPMVTRYVRHLRVEQPTVLETHHHYTVQKTAEYTLEANLGAVTLKKSGVPVSVVQVVPNPTNQQNMLLTSFGTGMHWENPGAHTAAHGGMGGSGDGLIGSLDFLSDTGHIRAITTTNVTVTTPQSLDDRYYSRNDVDALLLPLTTSLASLQAQVAVMSLQISAIQSAQLQVRINGVLQPCSRISFDSGSMATMYTDSVDHCHVWVTGPPVDPPS